MKYTCNWGIIGLGDIATSFGKDLYKDPKERNVDDVKHSLKAVATSNSKERSEIFAETVSGDKNHDINCYGSYEELVKDPDVEIVYIATPNSHHYSNCKLALENFKSVLCEKPFTVNYNQAKELISIAKDKNLFLMEGLWTRFFPLTKELQRLLFEENLLGNLKRVFSDFGVAFDLDNLPKTHRLLNPELGGGALLDIGCYALTWILMTAYKDPRNENEEPTVASGMVKNPLTGVDESTNISLVFPKSQVTSVVTLNFNVNSNHSSPVTIQGEKGNITVQWSPCRPESFEIHINGQESITKTFKISGHGMFWEADECARNLRDGKKESETYPLKESLLLMNIMDKVKRSHNLTFPCE